MISPITQSLKLTFKAAVIGDEAFGAVVGLAAAPAFVTRHRQEFRRRDQGRAGGGGDGEST